jgi:TonB family protein
MKNLTLTPRTVFVLVIVFLGLIALLLWLVLTPIKPTPPSVPKTPEVVVIPPPPPPPPPPPLKKAEEPVRAIGEIKQPKVIKRVEPVYPEEARQAGIQGIVILEATTDIYGRVQSVKVLRSIPKLDQAAIDAVKKWVYEPLVIGGKPRGVIFTVTVTFQLK